jgi:hypothetical protein
MREIKFRAWDKKYNKMYYGDIKTALAYPDKDIEIMQYTGLKDKNGKEIYEGDIVQIDDFSYGIFNAVVRWNEEKGMFAIKTFSPSPKQIEMPSREWDRKHPPCESDGCMYAMWYSPIGDQKELELIGNIYENSELVRIVP